MNQFDFAIIGSGVSGLTLSALLSKEGFNVALIEKNKYLGGNLSSFTRQNVRFETGVHYTSGFAQGEVLDVLYRHLGIRSQINAVRLDIGGFEKVHMGGQSYEFAQGYDLHIDKMCRYFPRSADEIKNFYHEIKKFGYYNSLEGVLNQNIDLNQLSVNAYQKIRTQLSDPLVFNVLTGTNPLYAGRKDYTPYMQVGHILDTYIRDSWRIQDGGENLVGTLKELLKKQGVSILTGEAASGLTFDGDSISGIKLNGSNEIKCKHVISTLHPQKTLELIPSDKLRKSYRSRIESLPNSLGMFNLFLVMKPESFPYFNHNQYHYSTQDSWIADIKDTTQWPYGYFVYSQASKDSRYSSGLVAMSTMNFEEVAKWSGLPVERRGQEYLDFKAQKTEQMLNALERDYPHIKSKIQSVYSSTPLTYENYYNMPQGAAYGIQRNSKDPLSSTVQTKTKIPNLYLAGQSVSFHGFFGVSVGSLVLASHLIGQEKFKHTLLNTL